MRLPNQRQVDKLVKLKRFSVYLCVGIKSSGKVVYFSATFPYLLLITLMIYALLQDGAIDGVKTLFLPKKWSGPGSVLDFNVG